MKQLNNLTVTHPELVKQWHPTLNGELQPTDVTHGSHKKVWWICPESSLHTYLSKINKRSIGRGCPYCAGRKVCTDNNLAFLNPSLAKEWHPTKNGILKPTDVTPRSSKKVWWICRKNPNHEWDAMIGIRSKKKGTGCPHCYKEQQTSFPEQAIYFYLKQLFPDALNRFIFEDSKLEVDIYIPQLNIGIEYDGSYYHQNTSKDERKSKFMMEHCNFVRIRERNCPILMTGEFIILVDANDNSLTQAIKELFQYIGEITKQTINYDINIERDRIAIYELLEMTEKENSLAVKYPDIAKEWHPTKNGKLQSTDVSYGSNKKVWWQCPVNSLHEWNTSIYHRKNGKGCPCCSGYKVCSDNNLAFKNPVLAKEWHPKLNGELQPTDVMPGSGKKVWWQCRKNPNHEWEATIGSRSNGQKKCPYCTGKKVCGDNNLAVTYPEIAKEWHPKLNGELQPTDIMPGSNKKVSWICNKNPNHEWNAKVNNRISGHDCPQCRASKVCVDNNLAMKYPDVAKEWHPTLNGELQPINVKYGSKKEFYWSCNRNLEHTWKASINNRTKGTGCPYCVGSKVCADNNLTVTHPELVKEWHPTKNGELQPTDVSFGSGKAVYWQCPKNNEHEYLSEIKGRSKGQGCPYCAGKKVCADNNLAYKHPELAKEWHPTKNEELNPTEVTYGSSKKVWWLCSNNSEHEWDATIKSRSNGSGCPHCYKEKRARSA